MSPKSFRNRVYAHNNMVRHLGISELLYIFMFFFTSACSFFSLSSSAGATACNQTENPPADPSPGLKMDVDVCNMSFIF